MTVADHGDEHVHMSYDRNNLLLMTVDITVVVEFSKCGLTLLLVVRP